MYFTTINKTSQTDPDFLGLGQVPIPKLITVPEAWMHWSARSRSCDLSWIEVGVDAARMSAENWGGVGWGYPKNFSELFPEEKMIQLGRHRWEVTTSVLLQGQLTSHGTTQVSCCWTCPTGSMAQWESAWTLNPDCLVQILCHYLHDLGWVIYPLCASVFHLWNGVSDRIYLKGLLQGLNE